MERERERVKERKREVDRDIVIYIQYAPHLLPVVDFVPVEFRARVPSKHEHTCLYTHAYTYIYVHVHIHIHIYVYVYIYSRRRTCSPWWTLFRRSSGRVSCPNTNTPALRLA